MIEGLIDQNLEAWVRLCVHHAGKTHEIDCLMDTGFNGYLAVSESIVRSLDLDLKDIQKGITADGRSSYFNTVDLQVTWHGRTTVVRAQVLDEPLLGTRMLRGSELRAVWKSGNLVTINECPSPEAR